jgi:hypothetical protein
MSLSTSLPSLQFFFLSKSVKQIAKTEQWFFPTDDDFALFKIFPVKQRGVYVALS